MWQDIKDELFLNMIFGVCLAGLGIAFLFVPLMVGLCTVGFVFEVVVCAMAIGGLFGVVDSVTKGHFNI